MILKNLEYVSNVNELNLQDVADVIIEEKLQVEIYVNKKDAPEEKLNVDVYVQEILSQVEVYVTEKFPGDTTAWSIITLNLKYIIDNM